MKRCLFIALFVVGSFLQGQSFDSIAVDSSVVREDGELLLNIYLKNIASHEISIDRASLPNSTGNLGFSIGLFWSDSGVQLKRFFFSGFEVYGDPILLKPGEVYSCDAVELAEHYPVLGQGASADFVGYWSNEFYLNGKAVIFGDYISFADESKEP